MKKILQILIVCLLLFASVLSFSSCTASDVAKEKIGNGWSAVKGFFQDVFSLETWNIFKDAFSEKTNEEEQTVEQAAEDIEKQVENLATEEQDILSKSNVSLSGYRVSLCSAEETVSLTAAETTSITTAGYDVYFNAGEVVSPEYFNKEQYNDYREYRIPLSSEYYNYNSFLHCYFLYDEEVTGYRLYSTDDVLLTSGDNTTATYADIMLYSGMTYKLQIIGLHTVYLDTFLNNQLFCFYNFSKNNGNSVAHYFDGLINSVWYDEQLEKALEGAREQAASDKSIEITNIYNKYEEVDGIKEELEVNIDTLNEAIRQYHDLNKEAQVNIENLKATLAALKTEEAVAIEQLAIAEKKLVAWETYCSDIAIAFKKKYAEYLTETEIDGIVSGWLIGVFREEEQL